MNHPSTGPALQPLTYLVTSGVLHVAVLVAFVHSCSI